MGCANSRLVREGSTDQMLPSKLGPILRSRLDNIRRRRRVADAMTLKESTLSTKELLKDAAAPYSSEDTSSRCSTSKPGREDNNEDDNDKSILRSLPCNDHIPPGPGEKELMKRLEEDNKEVPGKGIQPAEGRSTKESEDDELEMQKLREEKVIDAVTAAIEQVAMEEEEAEKNEEENKLDENDADNDSQMQMLTKSDDYLFPDSPSFRVYCVPSASTDDSDNDIDECRDVDGAPKTTSKSEDSSGIHESVNSNEDHESATNKNESNRSKGKLAKGLRKVIRKRRSGAMKNLLNVKSCYYPSCSGQDRTRLLSEKAADS